MPVPRHRRHPRPPLGWTVVWTAMVGTALVVSCSSDDATDSSTTTTTAVVATTATTGDTRAPDTDDTDDCELVAVDELALVLELPPPTLLQASPDGCLFSFTDAAGEPAGVGSMMRTDAQYGRDLLESLASYDDEGLEAFGMQRLQRSDGVEGTYSRAGFIIVVDDETYQFAIDGTEVDYRAGMLRMVDLVVDRHA